MTPISKDRLEAGARALRESQSRRAARTRQYLPPWDDLTPSTKADLIEDTEAVMVAVEKTT